MMEDDSFAQQRSVEVSNQYRQGMLGVAREWRAKPGGDPKGCMVGSIDLWSAILDDAGGQGEGLRPYFTYVHSLHSIKIEENWKVMVVSWLID